jgi:hypothetical protein
MKMAKRYGHMSDKAQRDAMALLASRPEPIGQQTPPQAPSAPMVPQPATIQ